MPEKKSITMVIQGGATGADQFAREWAKLHEMPFLTVPAKWKKQGNSAGPRRNSKMLRLGKPDVVYAFPGGSGTENMVMQSLAAGIEIELLG